MGDNIVTTFDEYGTRAGLLALADIGADLKPILLPTIASCEQLLSSAGETWVLPKLARETAEFPLYSLLTRQSPAVVDGDNSLYITVTNPEIEKDKLIPFCDLHDRADSGRADWASGNLFGLTKWSQQHQIVYTHRAFWVLRTPGEVWQKLVYRDGR